MDKEIDHTSDRYSPIDIEVKVAELLGSETLLHFDLEDKPIIAKIISLENFERGQHIKLAIDFDFAHFFDIDSEERIDIPNHGAYRKII